MKASIRKLDRESVNEFVAIETKADRRNNAFTGFLFEIEKPISAMRTPLPRVAEVMVAGAKMRKRPSNIRAQAFPGFSIRIPVHAEYNPIALTANKQIVHRAQIIRRNGLRADGRSVDITQKQMSMA